MRPAEARSQVGQKRKLVNDWFGIGYYPMLYFIILPAFALWLVLATLAVGVTKSVPRIAFAFPFVWRISLWATIGFVVANAVLVVLLTGGFFAIDRQPSAATEGGDTMRILWGVGAVVGPIIVSTAGWLLGAVMGAALSLRHRQRSAAPVKNGSYRAPDL